MALVDTLEEQALLERILDDSKPAVPLPCRDLHYLLFTPFRYGAPHPAGSRFRRAGLTPGVFYASQQPATAIAEIAFWRLLFFAESPRTPWPDRAAAFTVFAVAYGGRGLDLTRPPLSRDAERWTHPIDYAHCHELADTAREAGVLVLRYQSARTMGLNVALLSCEAFASQAPLERHEWRVHVGRMGVRAIGGEPEQRLAFDREAFARDPRIAALDWER